MPTRLRSLGRLVLGSCTEMPSTVISPFWNGSSALTVLISVDLPEPEGPQTTTTSPLLMLTEQSVQHLHRAVPLGNVLDFDHVGHSGSGQRMMAIFVLQALDEEDRPKQMMK